MWEVSSCPARYRCIRTCNTFLPPSERLEPIPVCSIGIGLLANTNLKSNVAVYQVVAKPLNVAVCLLLLIQYVRQHILGRIPQRIAPRIIHDQSAVLHIYAIPVGCYAHRPCRHMSSQASHCTLGGTAVTHFSTVQDDCVYP